MSNMSNISKKIVDNIVSFLQLYTTNYDRFFNIIYLMLLIVMIIGLIIVYVLFFFIYYPNLEDGFSKTLTIIIVSIIYSLFNISEYMYGIGAISNSDNFVEGLKKLLSHILIYLPIIFSIALIFSILNNHYNTNLGYFKYFFILIFLIPILLISILLNLPKLVNNKDMNTLKIIINHLFGFIFILMIASFIFMFEVIIIYTMKNIYTNKSCGVSSENTFDKTRMVIYHGIFIFFLISILSLLLIFSRDKFHLIKKFTDGASKEAVSYVVTDEVIHTAGGSKRKIKSKRK